MSTHSIDCSAKPASFQTVLAKELEEIDTLRREQGVPGAGTVSPSHTAIERARDSRLVGLAFSGGGIRSATFNLGIIQGLCELKLLPKFDYLSTVSGGGYIGSWLSGVIHRCLTNPQNANVSAETCARLKHATSGKAKFDVIQEELAVENQNTSRPSESPAITHLRRYSNYLTPRRGMLNADTLTSVTTYVRNFLLNLTVLILLLSSVLILPRLVVAGYAALGGGAPIWFQLLGVLIPLAVAATLIAFNLVYKAGQNPPFLTRQGGLLLLIVLPALIAAASLSYYFLVDRDKLNGVSLLDWAFPILEKNPALDATVGGLLLYLLVWIAGWLWGIVVLARQCFGKDQIKRLRSLNSPLYFFLISAFAIPAAGALGGLLFYWFTQSVLMPWGKIYAHNHLWFTIGYGTVVMLWIFSLIVTVHIGLMGRSFDEDTREWWSRLGGWLIFVGVCWGGLFTLAIFAAPFVHYLSSLSKHYLQAGGLAWLASSIGGMLLSRSAATGGPKSNRWLELAIKITPYIFVGGLLIILAAGLHEVFAKSKTDVPSCNTLSLGAGLHSAVSPVAYAGPTAAISGLIGCELDRIGPQTWHPVIIFVMLLIPGVLLSWRIDINLFSIYQYYKNRLVRAYLGASRKERQIQPFTGFDSAGDDLPMTTLAAQRPYHIVNTALNLVSGKELAWQQRKAASFAVTARYVGFQFALNGESDKPKGGYRPTAEYLNEHGIDLGQALAISGAAASPNMGYHSSIGPTFLMTVFNVRLGRWCGNPGARSHAKLARLADRFAAALGLRACVWQREGPQFGAWYLLRELLGYSDERTNFVYLSDGGHFENLGVYELVRRRCQLIVVCDAGADGGRSFDDLGNAIRKCYTDFGIDIEINVDALRVQPGTSRSDRRCAIGTIHYEREDPRATPGTLLYIKPTLTGNEPSDIINYAAEHGDFPHESTADQWFDESQFESYRKLGYHSCREVFAPAIETALANRGIASSAPVTEPDVEALCVALRQVWYPAAPAETPEAFTRHAAAIDLIFERLRSDKDLRFLDAQMYPEWERLEPIDRNELTSGLPNRPEELRKGFYICNSMIQLMENVYIDLNLEETSEHPDNRGWMNLFRHWAWCGMLRVTWAVAAATFGARFQNFCQRKLDLTIGEIEVDDPRTLSAELTLGALEENNVINFFERGQIDAFLAQNPCAEPQLYIFSVVVNDPQVTDKSVAALLKFPFGFALVCRFDHGERQLAYFRTQNHLRRMGLGRSALLALLRKENRHQRKLLLSEPRPLNGTLEDMSVETYQHFGEVFHSVQAELDAERPIHSSGQA